MDIIITAIAYATLLLSIFGGLILQARHEASHAE